jgi:hypothetical protein
VRFDENQRLIETKAQHGGGQQRGSDGHAMMPDDDSMRASRVELARPSRTREIDMEGRPLAGRVWWSFRPTSNPAISFAAAAIGLLTLSLLAVLSCFLTPRYLHPPAFSEPSRARAISRLSAAHNERGAAQRANALPSSAASLC